MGPRLCHGEVRGAPGRPSKGSPHGPDARSCPFCRPRGTWWPSAHTRAWCRSGMRPQGRSCPCWKATRHASVRSRSGPGGGWVPRGRATFSSHPLPGRRGAGLERRPALVREPGPHDPAEGHPHAALAVRASAAGPPAGGVWAQVVHGPPAARLRGQRQQGRPSPCPPSLPTSPCAVEQG